MKKLLSCLLPLAFVSLISEGQIINKVPLSTRVTGYKISARLDTRERTVTGKMHAFWVNKSSEIVPDIQLHMYMNAFMNNNSTMNRELGRVSGNDEYLLGRIDIKSFTDGEGNDLTSGMRYISPDDDNIRDKTVLQIMLPHAAGPGDTVFINVDFNTKLPFLTRRTGYNDDFYFVAQWFPKFGVYESAEKRHSNSGAWNCHQFHANSEFYSDHSVYDVDITVPMEYVLGTAGMLMDEKDHEADGISKTLTYRAEDIVDFVWTAWPDYQVFKDKWKNVSITLLIPPEHVNQVDRQFTAVKYALEYFSENVGPYPWPYMTIVDPSSKGSAAGGMEYTTLFTTYSVYMIPSFFHLPEMVTIHEFGHAYFMGILATNEFEDPWMDEGINSFWEERIMDHFYGENSGMIDHPFLKVPDKYTSRSSYIHSGSRQVISNREYSWNYPHGTYAMMSYMKAATWLYTLMGLIGEDTMNEVFREYYRLWSFKHPGPEDFTDVVNDVVRKTYGDKFGPDMNWFFDQTLYGTGICDYKVVNIINRKQEIEKGKTDSTITEATGTMTADSLYTSIAQLERAGDIILPEDILIHFSDGEEVSELWDGKSRFKDFTYEGKRKIVWVKIDPDYKIRMDVNFINNSMTLKPDRIPERRFAGKLILGLQMFLQLLTL